MNPVQRLLIIGIVQDEIAFGVITAFQNNNKYHLVCIPLCEVNFTIFFLLPELLHGFIMHKTLKVRAWIW